MVTSVSQQGSSIDEIRDRFEAGRYFAAYLLAHRSGLLEPDAKTPTRSALLGARILMRAGARRRARKIILDTWRRDREDPHALLYATFELSDAGPLPALEMMSRVSDAAIRGWPQASQSDWLATRALLLARLRDFVAADRACEAALERRSEPWTWCVRAMIEGMRDRPAAALEALAEARALSPWYRVAVELEAGQLCRLRRPDEALSVLAQATSHLESASVLWDLHFRHLETGALDDALACLELAARYSPAIEQAGHDRLARGIAYVHYLRGDVARSVAIRRLSGNDGDHTLASELETSAPAPRKLLAVPQVPQHHSTCAPATLTSIGEYWEHAADHLEIAEEICHDGTPAASERRWASERGFVVRELTVTWDAAVALIDAGLPFTLTTVFTTTAHAQAVVGYDARIRTFLIRDPSSLSLVECDADELLEHGRPFGPRGMVMVPADRAGPLDGIELPDAPLWDLHFEVENALRRHDRGAALAAYQTLDRDAPDHFVRHQARRAIASYDGDDHGVLEWLDAMLAGHPGDGRLLMMKLSTAEGLIGRTRRVEIAEALLGDHGKDPAVLARCASFLAEQGEDSARAAALARRAVAAGEMFAPAYRVLADREWVRGRRAEATRLYRIASCLAEADESAAWSYFIAASITGEIGPAIEHLEDRLARMQGRSPAPARTLCEAYAAAGRSREAVATLERARDLHPDDGFLLLALAEEHRLGGDLDAAERGLAAAAGKCHEPAWRRQAAMIAVHAGRREDAIELWRQNAAANPLDLASQGEYVEHLETTGHPDVARAHLEGLFARFPDHLAIGRLLHEHLRTRDDDAARRHLEVLVERHPEHGWALCELGAALARSGDLARASELLTRARKAGHTPGMVACEEANLAKLTKELVRARLLYREAISADVDHPGAIAALLDLAPTAAEAGGQLDFVARELTRQGSHGHGIVSYGDAARRWLDPHAAVARIHELRTARPHVSLAWATEVDALLDLGDLERALAVATEATARFERAPSAWRDLALVHERRGDTANRIAALERARKLAPGWNTVVRLLSEAYQHAQDPARARELLEHAIAAEPLNGLNHGFLAELAWTTGRQDEARETLRQALRLTPEYGWAWEKLIEWSADARAVAQFAREVTASKPAAIRPVMVIAEHDVGQPLDERIALLRAQHHRAPDRVEIPDLAATLLALGRRWDEALAACRPAFWGKSPPLTLRGRAAWIRAQRGDRRGAIDEMLEVIAGGPSYEWGISRLMEWAREIDDYLGVAERAVTAAPAAALAHAHLGEALREIGEPRRAEPSFRRALDLDRGCFFARLGLFDVLYARGDHDGAAPLLDGMPAGNCFVMARRIQIDVISGRDDEADARFRSLVEDETADPVTVEEAYAGYAKAGAWRRAEALLERAVHEPDAGESIGRAWYHCVAQRGSMASRRSRVRALPESSPAGRWCTATLVEEHGERLALWELAVFLLLNHRWLRARSHAWGSVGYVLLAADLPRLARWWMRDFERRRDVEPWMLLNLARANFWLGAVSRGWAICRRALGLAADRTTPRHRLLLAASDALGEPSAARHTLAEVTIEDRDEDRFLVGLTEALLAYRDASGDPERGARLVTAVRELVERVPGARSLRVCLGILHQVTRELAAEVGGGLSRRSRRALEWMADGYLLANFSRQDDA